MGRGLRRLSAGAGAVMPLYQPLPGDAKECPRVPAEELLPYTFSIFTMKCNFSRKDLERERNRIIDKSRQC